MFVQRNPGRDLHSPHKSKESKDALDASLIRWLSSLKVRAEPAVVQAGITESLVVRVRMLELIVLVGLIAVVTP